MSDEKILVPIKIEALMVDAATSKESAWKDMSLQYLGMHSRIGAEMDAGELRSLQSSLCEKGIHLHWALPAALTTGIYSGDAMVMPAVPNRWLIIRTAKVTGKPAITKIWILESDNPDGTTPWVIQNKDGSFENVEIGKPTELKLWTAESTRLAEPLTAFAPGDPAFAAIYSSCRNIFGFYDKAADIDKGNLSYMVAGWYSDASINPLNNKNSEIAKSILSKWTIGANDNMPSDILCHGYIHSLEWDNKGNYPFAKKKDAVNVGIGYTAVEAKSVQIARQTGTSEQLLSAYFYDILKNTEGASVIDTMVDDRAFTSVEGGIQWDIRRKEDKAVGSDKKEVRKNNFPDEHTNPGLGGLLQTLNQQQVKYDRMLAEKTAMQVEFRALLDKLIKAGDEEPTRVPVLTRKRDSLRSEIDATLVRLGTLEKDIEGLKKNINSYPVISAAKSEFELIEEKQPRYWKPNDPVSVFSGPGITNSHKYKNAGSTEKLTCRLTGELTAVMVLYDSDRLGEKNTTAPALSLDMKIVNSSLSVSRIDTIKKLYAEAVLFDPAWADEWAYHYYDSYGRENTFAKALADNIKKVIAGNIDGNNVNIRQLITTGGIVKREQVKTAAAMKLLLTDIGVQQWAHPWTPVYMIWYARWMPGYTEENGEWSYKSNDWVWKDKKYTYTGRAFDENKAIQYSGKAILTDGINSVLDERLPVATKEYNISQALSSFSSALLMRRERVQLPLLKNENGVLKRDRSFDLYTTPRAYFSPNTDSSANGLSNFFPIRAGQLRVTHLWITDTFGQVQRVVDTTRGNDARNRTVADGHVFTSASMNQETTRDTDRFTITLSPRIVQSSRLSFRWISANQPNGVTSCSDPATTPLCGWVLPDFINNSLDIYEASGKGCGSVRADKNMLVWRGLPGNENETAVQSITNQFLLGFVNGLLSNKHAATGNILNELIELCTARAAFINSSSSMQSPGVAGLIGQPLALVRASLRLELLGLPAQPQGWNEGLTPEIKDVPTGLVNTLFPVSLGDARNAADGLIGYFPDSAGFDNMHQSFGSTGKKGYFVKEDVQLAFSAEQRSVNLTMLLDPRGGVQADCGILPSKMIDLPARYTEQGLQDMELHLLVAPFLGMPSDPDLPVSTEPGNAWSLRQNKSGVWTESILGKQAPLSINSIGAQMAQEGYLVLKKDKK